MAISMHKKWVSALDKGQRRLWIVPICNPQGVVKYVRVSKTIQSELVIAKYNEQGLNPELESITLEGSLESEGWKLIADLYRDARLPAGWEAFRNHMLSTQMCTPGAVVKPFPAKYLPPGVHERRAGKAAHQVEPDEIVIPEMDDWQDEDPTRPVHTSKAKRRAAGLDVPAGG